MGDKKLTTNEIVAGLVSYLQDRYEGLQRELSATQALLLSLEAEPRVVASKDGASEKKRKVKRERDPDMPKRAKCVSVLYHSLHFALRYFLSMR